MSDELQDLLVWGSFCVGIIACVLICVLCEVRI